MLKENIKAIVWLASVSKGNRVFLFLSMILAMLSGCISLVPFLLLFKMVQAVIDGNVSTAEIYTIAVWSLVAITAKYILSFSSTMCSHKAAFEIQYNLREDIVEHIGKLPLGFFTRMSSGTLRKITSEDVENLEIYIAHHIPDTVSSLVLPVVIFAIIASQDVFLLLPLGIPLILIAIALSAISRIRAKHVKEYFDNAENMNSSTVEYIKAIPVIKIFNVSVDTFTKFYDSIEKQIAIACEWIRKTSPYSVLFRTSLDFILPLLMFSLAASIYLGWSIDLTAYVLCIVSAAVMAKAIARIFISSNLLCSLMEGASRVEQLMSMEPIAQDNLTTAQPGSFRIRYHNVSFAYDEVNVLHDINLELNDNGLYALVGESGSGKTTTGQLLLRFWDAQQGSISLGGIDIKHLPLELLLKNISFAFQDPFIIDGTIMENISMMRTDVPSTDMVEAAKIVKAHDFISQLPSGYDTMLGSDGVRLSAGEKQRICLARAILKKTPILILDEPTSQVDARVESNIFHSIKSYCKDRIVIFVTHRLATAYHANNIFVFDDGRIIASGSHDTLLVQCPKYEHMWALANKASNWSL